MLHILFSILSVSFRIVSARILFLLCLLWISGCHFRVLGYQNSPALISQWLDNRFDLSGTQEDSAEEELQRLLQWHMQSEIPILDERLGQIRERVQAGDDEVALAFAFREIERMRDAVFEKSLPQVAHFFAQLTPEQIEHYQKERAEEWEKRAERLADEKDDLEHHVDRLESRFEDWIGDLTKEQIQLLQAYSQASRSARRLWLELSQESTKYLMGWLRERAGERESGRSGQPEIRAAGMTSLDSVVSRIREASAIRLGRDHLEKEVIESNRAAMRKLVLEVFTAGLPGSRQAFMSELSDLHSDVQEVIRDREEAEARAKQDSAK